jgi:hypothetical protein
VNVIDVAAIKAAHQPPHDGLLRAYGHPGSIAAASEGTITTRGYIPSSSFDGEANATADAPRRGSKTVMGHVTLDYQITGA